jgi:hypothetical protein
VDAVQALGQHLDEEAADELAGGEYHALVSIAARDAVVPLISGQDAPLRYRLGCVASRSKLPRGLVL